MRTTKEILEAALALIRKPENWCQGILWKGSAYCSLGAIYQAYGRIAVATFGAQEALEWHTFPETLVTYNDAPSRTHAEIVALFEREIAVEAT